MKLLLKILFKILKVLSTVAVIVALIVVISQRVTNNKLRLFGYGVYTVITESMLPEYEVGDMFLAKEVEQDDIKLGDDIVYIGEVDSYKDKVITHRVIRIEQDKTIVTKGINNSMEDPPIQYKQVYGKVSARLIVLSLFSKLMNENVLFYLIVFVPFTVLIFLDTKDMFDEKKKKEKEAVQGSTEAVSPVVPQQPSPTIQQEPSPVVPQPVSQELPQEVKIEENKEEVKEEPTENKE